MNEVKNVDAQLAGHNPDSKPDRKNDYRQACSLLSEHDAPLWIITEENLKAHREFTGLIFTSVLSKCFGIIFLIVGAFVARRLGVPWAGGWLFLLGATMVLVPVLILRNWQAQRMFNVFCYMQRTQSGAKKGINWERYVALLKMLRFPHTIEGVGLIQMCDVFKHIDRRMILLAHINQEVDSDGNPTDKAKEAKVLMHQILEIAKMAQPSGEEWVLTYDNYYPRAGA